MGGCNFCGFICEALCQQGDTLAIDEVSEAAEVFGIAIADVVNFFKPRGDHFKRRHCR